MKKEQDNWILQPTKRTVIIVTIIWLIGSILTILAATDLFRESIFQYKNVTTIFMLAGSLASVLYVYRNYRKTLSA